MEHTTLTTCPVRIVLSLYKIPPPRYGTHNTDHMSSTYRPYNDCYIRSQQPHMEHKTLITYPVRSFQSLYLNIPPTYRTHNTDHMSSTYRPYDDCYIRSQQPHMEHKTLITYPVRSFQSLYLNIPPTYKTNNTDHMSSKYSPITILDTTTHIQNTQH